jgi:hypothetical protein
MPGSPSYAGHRFPAEVISHAVWLYFRFPLSLRMVEEMLAARGIIISHESVRQWARKCRSGGQNNAHLLQSFCLYTSLALCKCHILDNPSAGLRAGPAKDREPRAGVDQDTERGPTGWGTDRARRAKAQGPRADRAMDQDQKVGRPTDRAPRAGQTMDQDPHVPGGNQIAARCWAAPWRARPAPHSRARGYRAIRGWWRLPRLSFASAPRQ